MQSLRVARTEGQRLLKTSWKTANSESTDAQYDARSDLSFDLADNLIDADLQTIIENWPTLPAAIKAGILAMIRVTDG